MDVLRVADRAVDEADVDVAVGQRLDVGVLEVGRRGPERDVGDGDDVEQVLVDLEERDVAATTTGGAVHAEPELAHGYTASFRLEAFHDSGPSSRTCSVISAMSSA